MNQVRRGVGVVRNGYLPERELTNAPSNGVMANEFALQLTKVTGNSLQRGIQNLPAYLILSYAVIIALTEIFENLAGRSEVGSEGIRDLKA